MPDGMVFHQVLLLSVIFGAYLIRGITGFGSGLIAVPVLAFFYPLQFAVPLVMTLDFIASFVLGNVDRKKTDWREIRMLLPFGLIGAAFGVFALIRFPSSPVLICLGAFVMFFGMRNLLGLHPRGEISSLWAIPAGLIGSSAGALFGTSAPPYIIYLTHRLQDKSVARATFSWLFVIDGGFRICLFVVTGLLLDQEVLRSILVGLIPMSIGLYFGNRVHINITQETMLRIVGGILVGSGGTLIAKVLI